MSKELIILGAGMAGMLAACKFPNADILEVSDKPAGHQAILRFRSEEVSKLTGIPFKKVEVQKAIQCPFSKRLIQGETPIDVRNMYAMKVSGMLIGRSIGNLATSTRYIAPDDFHQQLLNRFSDRISYGVDAGDIAGWVRRHENTKNWLSTAPMKNNLDLCAIQPPEFGLNFNSIRVDRYKFDGFASDVYQTVYFPAGEIDVYRASITGDTLIIESTVTSYVEDKYLCPLHENDLNDVCWAFGITAMALDEDSRQSTCQRIGKMVDLPKGEREHLLYDMTTRFGLFSVGRFACWRNILLDDVVSDLGKVDALLKASQYTRALMK